VNSSTRASQSRRGSKKASRKNQLAGSIGHLLEYPTSTFVFENVPHRGFRTLTGKTLLIGLGLVPSNDLIRLQFESSTGAVCPRCGGWLNCGGGAAELGEKIPLGTQEVCSSGRRLRLAGSDCAVSPELGHLLEWRSYNHGVAETEVNLGSNRPPSRRGPARCRNEFDPGGPRGSSLGSSRD